MRRARATSRTRRAASWRARAASGLSRARARALVFVWLGLFHALAALAVALAVWATPGARVAVACVVVSLGVAPRGRRPAWGTALAREITRAAVGYFPASLAFEDERAYLADVRRGRGRSWDWNRTVRCR